MAARRCGKSPALLLLVPAIWSLTHAHPQELPAGRPDRDVPAGANQEPVTWAAPNGITVTGFKVFDERSLLEKLQALKTHLATLNMIDDSKIAEKLGAIQASLAQYSSLTFQANLLAPSVTTETTKGKTTTTTTAPSAPEAVEAPETPAAPEQPAELAVASRDLLAEQLQVMSDIINYQMLLDMSLTDRVYDEAGAHGSRLRTVIGFPICVEPRYKNAVAEVEVILRTVGTTTAPASVVFLMPDERTYNVSTLTNRSRAFGLGGLVHLLAPGLTASSGRNDLYLVRDQDTVAFIRPQERYPPQHLRFGWQFRPVLGRKTVNHIPDRLMLASLALPATDEYQGYSLSATVTTRWRKFDRKTKIVGEPIDGSEADYEFTPPKTQIPVWTPGEVNERLTPQVTHATVRDAGKGNVIVDVEGRLFMPGTVVRLGETTYTTDTAFVRHSEQRLRFVAPALALLQSEPLLIGPYGENRTLLNYRASGRPELIGTGCKVTARTTTTSHVTLYLKLPAPPAVPAAGHAPGTSHQERVRDERWQPKTFVAASGTSYGPSLDAPLVVLIGEKLFGLSDAPMVRDANSEGLRLEFDVDNELLRKNDRIVVQQLLDPPEQAQVWKHGFSDFTVSRVVLLGTQGERARIAVEGTGLDETVTLMLGSSVYGPGGTGYLYQSPTVLTFESDLSTWRTSPNLIAQKGKLPPIVLSTGDSAQPTGRPTIEDVPAVTEGQEGPIIIKGTNLGTIEAIRYGDTGLKFSYDAATNTITVTLIKEVTGTAGRVVLTIELRSGEEMQCTLTVNPTPTATPTVNFPDPIYVGDAKDVSVTGENLTSIVSVSWGEKTLAYFAAPDGKSAKLTIPAELTAKEGRQSLVFVLKDKKTVRKDVEVLKKPTGD